MSLTLLDTLNFSAGFIQGEPIYAWTGYNPAVTIATMVRNTIMNAPFTWPWNRNESTGLLTLAAGTQDYTVALTDFAYLEKISLLATAPVPPSATYQYEIKNIHNTYALAAGRKQSQPDSACVKYYTPGTNLSLRFLAVPDQAYAGTITYQKLPIPFKQFSITAVGNAAGGNTSYTGTFIALFFTAGNYATVSGFANAANNGTFAIVSCNATTLVLANPSGSAVSAAATVVNSDWGPIPDSFSDIYNNLFLAEAFAAADDARTQEYRVRGIAALLSKAEGLSQMQVNAFLSQWFSTTEAQTLARTLGTQQGLQGRAT